MKPAVPKGPLAEQIFSPRGFLLRAVLLAGFFLLLQFAGWRDYTRVLSGTVEPGNAQSLLPMIAGAAYVFAYVGVTLFAPILAIAAGLLWLRDRRARERGNGQS